MEPYEHTWSSNKTQIMGVAFSTSDKLPSDLRLQYQSCSCGHICRDNTSYEQYNEHENFSESDNGLKTYTPPPRVPKWKENPVYSQPRATDFKTSENRTAYPSLSTRDSTKLTSTTVRGKNISVPQIYTKREHDTLESKLIKTKKRERLESNNESVCSKIANTFKMIPKALELSSCRKRSVTIRDDTSLTFRLKYLEEENHILRQALAKKTRGVSQELWTVEKLLDQLQLLEREVKKLSSHNIPIKRRRVMLVAPSKNDNDKNNKDVLSFKTFQAAPPVQNIEDGQIFIDQLEETVLQQPYSTPVTRNQKDHHYLVDVTPTTAASSATTSDLFKADYFEKQKKTVDSIERSNSLDIALDNNELKC